MLAGKIFWQEKCAQVKTFETARDQIFLTESWWAIRPVDIVVCNSLFTNDYVSGCLGVWVSACKYLWVYVCVYGCACVCGFL